MEHAQALRATITSGWGNCASLLDHRHDEPRIIQPAA
jgi:hypothetical protein